jgi:hypothetical protein
MALCDGAHQEYDAIANGKIQVGTLPDWTRIGGRVAWWVAKGPFSGLNEAWATFHRKLGEARPGRADGPPGIVFACNPDDHVADREANVLTIMYLPLG